MDSQRFNKWWDLHLRVARGEALSTEEQEQYQAGITELDAEEKTQVDLSALDRMRDRIAELDQENAFLRKERRW